MKNNDEKLNTTTSQSKFERWVRFVAHGTVFVVIWIAIGVTMEANHVEGKHFYMLAGFAMWPIDDLLKYLIRRKT